MFLIDKIAEDKIREAQERGEFRDLPLAGVPYRMDGYLFEDPRFRLENKILRDHNFLPLPLELKKRIETEREKARALIDSFRPVYQARLAELLNTLPLEPGYSADEYTEHLERHRRLLQRTLPLILQTRPSSRLRFQIFLLNRAVRQRANRLEEHCNEMLRLISLYNQEILRATLKRRDMFRNFTTMGTRVVEILRQDFRQRYPMAQSS